MEGVGAIFIFLILVGFYFLPTIIANKREKKNTTAIFVSNLLLGWFPFAWIFILIWSFMED